MNNVLFSTSIHSYHIVINIKALTLFKDTKDYTYKQIIIYKYGFYKTNFATNSPSSILPVSSKPKDA